MKIILSIHPMNLSPFQEQVMIFRHLYSRVRVTNLEDLGINKSLQTTMTAISNSFSPPHASISIRRSGATLEPYSLSHCMAQVRESERGSAYTTPVLQRGWLQQSRSRDYWSTKACMFARHLHPQYPLRQDEVARIRWTRGLWS